MATKESFWIITLKIVAVVFGLVVVPFTVIEVFGPKMKKLVIPIQLLFFAALLIWWLKGYRQISHDQNASRKNTSKVTWHENTGWITLPIPSGVADAFESDQKEQHWNAFPGRRCTGFLEDKTQTNVK